MLTGSFTALVTPFSGNAIDEEGLDRLVDFQCANGMTGILAVGTTGESPVLSWEEHNAVIEKVAKRVKGKGKCIAGTGSNNTKECLAATEHAAHLNVDGVLLVDPYYNGPSSLEIRKEYMGPVAKAFPGLEIIPYVIPGRTGCQLLPEDLALLSKECPNVSTVKEATANLDNMKRTRKLCGSEFSILSGDDGLTFQMMTDPEIQAQGVISVVSNVVPGAVSQMVRLLSEGNVAEAEAVKNAIAPLFGLVTVKTTESTPYGDVVCRSRNPSAIKTLMAILGMPSGGLRPPLGKMTQKGLDKVLEAAREVFSNSPELFKPVEEFFGVNVEERLHTPTYWEGLTYEAY